MTPGLALRIAISGNDMNMEHHDPRLGDGLYAGVREPPHILHILQVYLFRKPAPGETLHAAADQRYRQRPRHRAQPAAARQQEAEERCQGRSRSEGGWPRQPAAQAAQTIAQLAARLHHPELGIDHR